MNEWLKELCELIDKAGLTASFDRFRDSTKGCGPHCKAWVGATSDVDSYCDNHRAAIERGEYKANETN